MNTKSNNKIPAKIAEEINLFSDYLDLERGLMNNTCLSYRSDIEKFFLYVDEIGADPTKLRPRDIGAYVEHLRSLALLPSSINHNLSTVKEYYRFLVSWKRIKENPAENVHGARTMSYSPRSLGIDEVTRLLEMASQAPDRGALRDSALLEFLYATGARVSEAIGVRRSDLFLIGKDRMVKLTGKRNKERIVPIADIAWTTIEKYLNVCRPKMANEKSGDCIFLTRTGKMFTRMGIWKIIRKYVDMAGIKKRVSPHTLRHCFATHLMLGGADIFAIQELLGHSDPTTTEIYTHTDIDYLISQHEQFHPRERLETSFKLSGEPVGKIRLRKRGKNWHLHYQLNGKRVSKTCKTDNRDKAEALRSKTEKELFGDVVDSKAWDGNPSLKKPEGETAVEQPRRLSVKGSRPFNLNAENKS